MRAILDHVDSHGDEVDGRAAVFGWISEEMAARHAESTQPIGCIMDGEESLWNMRDVFQEEVPMIDILDLLHVTPRLWDAAALFHPRESDAATLKTTVIGCVTTSTWLAAIRLPAV